MTFLALAVVSGGIAASTPEDAAQKSAERWLSLIDAGKFVESWKTAAEYFQAAVPQKKWQRSLEAVRSRSAIWFHARSKTPNTPKSLPGTPDGEYVVLQFETSFANKKDAIETDTSMLEKDGPWRVSGYYIA